MDWQEQFEEGIATAWRRLALLLETDGFADREGCLTIHPGKAASICRHLQIEAATRAQCTCVCAGCCPLARGCVTALTSTNTMIFKASATKPIFTSLATSGRNGNNWPMLRCISVVTATTATPARIPQNAPCLVARLRGARLHTMAGNSWVTKL